MIQAPVRPHHKVRFSAATSEAPPQAADVPSTLTALPGGVLDGGELILLAIKPSMWRPLFDSAPWLIVCGAVAIILTSMGRTLAGLSLVASAEVVLLVGMTRLALAVVRWVPTWYVLTNRRIITIHGVRHPHITACLLLEIREVFLGASPMERLVRLGSISITANDDRPTPLFWQSIQQPEEVHDKIRRAIRNATDQQGLG